jgi:cyclohexanecarboxylate-CoA ligase
MAFEIFLPQSRIEASRGLWPNRLPIDDLDAAVAKHPGRTAFVGLNSALGQVVRLTYAELGERVDKIAAGLVGLGVGTGDVVAFQLPNWWEFTALFFACNRIGAAANPLMPIFRQREMRYMLGFGDAKLVVVPTHWRRFDHLAMIGEIRCELPNLRHVFAVGGEGDESFERTFLDRPPASTTEKEQFAALRPGPNDVVQLIYTSGTSGEPKAVMHIANTVVAPAQCFIDDIPVTGADVIISFFARCTSTRGIGAPAHTQVRKVRLTRARGSCGRFTMSERNGVDAIVKVAPSRSISAAASPSDHRSSATVLVASMTGISMP